MPRLGPEAVRPLAAQPSLPPVPVPLLRAVQRPSRVPRVLRRPVRLLPPSLRLRHLLPPLRQRPLRQPLRLLRPLHPPRLRHLPLRQRLLLPQRHPPRGLARLAPVLQGPSRAPRLRSPQHVLPRRLRLAATRLRVPPSPVRPRPVPPHEPPVRVVARVALLLRAPVVLVPALRARATTRSRRARACLARVAAVRARPAVALLARVTTPSPPARACPGRVAVVRVPRVPVAPVRVPRVPVRLLAPVEAQVAPVLPVPVVLAPAVPARTPA